MTLEEFILGVLKVIVVLNFGRLCWMYGRTRGYDEAKRQYEEIKSCGA